MKRGRRAALVAGVACSLGLAAAAVAHPALDEQIAALDAAIARVPSDATLYLRRGELHRMERAWGAAIADCRRARGLDPKLDAADLCLGRAFLESGQFGKARRALDRFLDRRPGHAEALIMRGRALAGDGRFLPAAADFARAADPALSSAPPGPEPYLGRSAALAAAGDAHLGEALAALDEGIARLGPLVTLQLPAIDLELRRAGYDAALGRLQTLAARSERQESWLVRRGEILALAGRPAEALEAYRSARGAIATLPANRRGARAMIALEERVEAGLKHLSPKGTGAGEGS